MVSVLADLPLVSQVTKYLDGCSCARASKEEVAAIKAELESKDAAIERLESEIRQKDLEKDNLMTMQKVLQEQISQIRADLEAQSEDATPAAAMKPGARKPAAGKVSAPLSDQEKAAQRMQARQRGKLDRRAVEEKAVKGELVGQKRQKSKAAERIGARARGKFDRRKVEERKAAGDLPGMKRLAAQDVAPPSDPIGADAALAAYDEAEAEAEEEESVDSDYDYDDSAFVGMGAELLSGSLKLAKVYGQEEPPAAEEELEWETRYFILYASQRMVHYDGLDGGQPAGDRGLVVLDQMKAVEKVLGVDTFVIKGDNKVYLLKLEPHDEALMRTWIAAIQQQMP